MALIKEILPTTHDWLLLFLIVVIFTGMFWYFDGRISDLEEVVQKPLTEIRLPEKGWQTLTSFEGTGSKITESFYVPSDRWRINWELQTPERESGYFSIKVYQETTLIKYDYYNPPTFPTQTHSETTHLSEGKANFYLDIEAVNITGWQIIAESLK